MERLQTWFYKNINNTDTTFKRYLWDIINWNSRLIIIYGARGVGKTTLMLQYIKEKRPIDEQTVYVSLDDIYFINHTLLYFTEEFTKRGGKYLFLDEVQKYRNWSTEIKALHDNFPDLKIVLSGSSAIELLKSEGDLSRRALYYQLNGLSFREYLNFQHNLDYGVIKLKDIVEQALPQSLRVNEKIKPIKEFEKYVAAGYYPFFTEDITTYHKRIAQVINMVLDVDIPNSFAIDTRAVYSLKKLLAEIVEMVPFKPNIKKLSDKIGVSRDSLLKYLQLLEKADVINMVYSQTKGISALNKPEKIYLNNPNLAYSLNSNVNIGSLREAFFVNQLKLSHKIRYSEIGDFVIDDDYVFEIGGRNKTNKQIAGIKNSWVVADNIEIAVDNKIPLWLMGFNY